MPVNTSMFVEAAVTKMLASCPPTWAPNNNTRELFKSFASAYADMLDSWLKSIQAVGGIVAGGAAPPGGPVVGAMLTLSPGSAQASVYKKVKDVFDPPRFSITLPTGEVRTGSFTPWLRGAVNTVSTEVDTQLKAWLAGWAGAGLSVVVGGTAAWAGAVAGLVGITPAAGFVGPQGALAIGVLTAAGAFWASVILKRKLGYDDSLDAFGIHGFGGLIGAILTGVFFSNQIFGGDATVGTQLFTQVKDALTTVVYSGVATFVILKVVSAICGGLRVEKDVEREGLDLNVHGERVE